MTDTETIISEADVPSYTLPDPLVTEDGRPVSGASVWWDERRPEILELFERHIYGVPPGSPERASAMVVENSDTALGGAAVRKQVALTFEGNGQSLTVNLLLYVPVQAKRSAPAFVGLNFYGNHTVCDDPAIPFPTGWLRENEVVGIENGVVSEASRGARQEQWSVQAVVERGYALATAHYADFVPDTKAAFRTGVHRLFDPPGEKQALPGPDEWGAIGSWAWGLRRIMDYLEQEPGVDERRVAVVGHSRLGKTALWAAAQDKRFALAISNGSGCAGAALSRRCFGETVRAINDRFPYWFCDTFKRYNDREQALPVDQHMLLALIAPRPVYVASAVEDLWADPRGEFLSARAVGPVYRLLGGRPMAARQEMPPLHQPILTDVGYHVRAGGHDVTAYDWGCFLDFVDLHLSAR